MAKFILEKINLASLVLMKPMTLDERYKSIVDEAIKVVGADYGSIFLYNGEFKRVYSTVPKNHRFHPRKQGNTEKTFISGKTSVMSSEDMKNSHFAFYKKGVKSVVLIPLVSVDEKIGVLSLDSSISKEYDELQIQALNLFGSLAALAIQNSRYFEQLEDSIKTRDLFISLASHELKTPLTTVMVYASLIDKKIRNNEAVSSKKTEIVVSEAKRLKNIIEEFLTFEQITNRRLRYSWDQVKIIEVIDKSIINFKALYPHYKTVVENKLLGTDGVIQADAEKLQQVFSNILTNAAKFSSPFTPILIEVERHDHHVNISFNDYGRGMKKAEQGKVFNEFYKESGNRMPGMGLGLYLVKNIIEEHDGSIEVDAKLHRGTKFIIKLPVAHYGAS